MSEANKNIEDLFKEKLENHESIVRADLWNSISSSLPAAASSAGTGIALKTKILIGAAASIITAATVYYVNTSNQGEKQTSPQKTEQSPSTENTKNTTAEAPDSIIIERNTAAATNNLKEASVNTNAQELTIQTVEFKDRVNTDLQNLNIYYARMSSAPETTDQHSEIVSEKDKLENESSIATSKNQAQPPVMQIKEVDNNSLLYFLFSPQKASAYEWWIDGKLVSNNPTLNYSFEEDGQYQIRLVTITDDGNTNETSQTIEAYRSIKFNLPNAFSPNGDGMNDSFDVKAGIEHFQNIDRLIIRDKQGKTIYESTINFVWDGNSMDGNICPSGVYTYTIFATDMKSNPHMKGGTIQLFIE